jgi:hypothetical protein
MEDNLAAKHEITVWKMTLMKVEQIRKNSVALSLSLAQLCPSLFNTKY